MPLCVIMMWCVQLTFSSRNYELFLSVRLDVLRMQPENHEELQLGNDMREKHGSLRSVSLSFYFFRVYSNHKPNIVFVYSHKH